MAKLKDIVKGSQDSNSPGENAGTSIANTITTMMSLKSVAFLGIARDKQAEFAAQAASLVTDDEFLDELQDKIGKPLANESEDEFVANAKIKMRELLKSKLK